MRASIFGGLLALSLYSTASAQITIIDTFGGSYGGGGSGQEIVPNGAAQVAIEEWGGGGGGGNSNTFTSGRGGGGGGYVKKTIEILPSDWGKALNWVRAARAFGYGINVGDGDSGNQSSVDTSNLTNHDAANPTVIALGGAGGSSAITGPGGEGGGGMGAVVINPGGTGDTAGSGGEGGQPGGGAGGGVPTGSSKNGHIPGGGGGGGTVYTTGAGDGAVGQVRFTWTITIPTPTPAPALPTVSVQASRTQLREGADSTITFSTDIAHSDLFVNYSISGRAIRNADYSLTDSPGGRPGVVFIPANESSVSIVLHAIPDTIREVNGDPAVITVVSGDGYIVPFDKATNRVIVLILDRKG